MPRKMRDSGVEWIGQVPEGWGIRRFKFVSTALRKGCGITKDQVFDDGDVPCVRYGEIYSKYINAFDRCQSKTRREFVPEPVYVSKGDILFACTGELVEEIGKNILYNGELPCVAGGDILVASHKQNAAFLNYYLNCHTSQFQKSRGKTKLKVVHARTSDIGNLLVLLPPMPEQERIAAYLDARCEEIKAAVAAARQSIEDYKALKKSLVFEAVTGKRKVSATLTQRAQRSQRDAESVGADVLGRPPGCEADRINRIYRIESEMPTAANAKDAKIRKDGDETLRSFANSAFSASAPAGSQNPCNPCNPWLKTSRPMRDSGVDWIGQVPDGWRVAGGLVDGTTETTGTSGTEAAFQLADNCGSDHAPCLGSPGGLGSLVPDGWRTSRVKYIAKIENGSDPQSEGDVPVYGSGATSFRTCGEFKEGPAVLLGRKGATLHIPHYITGRYWNVDTAFDVKMKCDDCLRWFYYLACCFDYDFYKSQTTLPGMTQTNYNNMRVPLPPLAEQRAIADYLDEKCGAIDALVAEKESLIADLEQYKKSLIFECVTGKREVA